MRRNTEFSYRSLHGAPRGRRRLLYATILVIVIVLLDLILGGKLRAEVRVIGSSIWRASGTLRASITDTGYFKSHKALAEENASLRAQIASTRERAAGFDVLQAENDQLRAFLHLASSTSGITAPVVSSVGSSPYGTFSVGAGTDDGIAQGDMVITPGGFAAGIVSDVGNDTSLVAGLFASGRSVDVVIAGAAATAEGEGGGNARATLPRGVEVEVGDIVTVPSFGGRAAGVVGHIEAPAGSGESTLYINLPVNLSALPFVYIVAHP